MKLFTVFMLVLSLHFTFIETYTRAEEPDEENTPDALMLRYPDVSRDSIAFVYAGDIWIVRKTGGVARRLTSSDGREQYPKFSPDGTEIAFSGNYDGNMDIYIIPSAGGSPDRLTHHPDSDLVVEWYPDGKDLLFRSNMKSHSQRYNRFFRQSVDGGLPEALPLPYAESGTFSPDGENLVFQYISPEPGIWKHYRGGMTSDIWSYNLAEHSLQKLTEFDGTDSMPMWRDNIIYFLSDRGDEGRLNIWRLNNENGDFEQATEFEDFDVKWASMGPEDIVFENGGRIYLMSLDDQSVNPVSITVPDDLPDVRASYKDLSEEVVNFSLSPTGKRALFEARGEVFTVPAGNGSTRNITRSSGVAERFPAWTPDGSKIAYFSDKSGEYELYTISSDGTGDETEVTSGGDTFRFNPVFSPDGKKVAFSDRKGRLFLTDVKSGKQVFVDKDDVENIDFYSWSPDSRWLAYAKRGKNGLKSIILYDTRTKKEKRVTSQFYNDNSPVFDPNGKYIYYYSDSSFTPVYGDMDDTWIYPNSTELYALPLNGNVDSPLAVKNDEELVLNKADKSKGSDGPVAVDFDGIYARAVKLPLGAGNFGTIAAVEGKVIFLRYPPAGTSGNGSNGKIQYYDLSGKNEGTVMTGVDDFRLSADGKKILYRAGNRFGVTDISDGKKVGQGEIDMSGVKTLVDPREEWGQIFNEAWRIMRDFFYDPGMHGVDWEAVKQRYEGLLPYVVDREDLNYVLGEMIGELNSSHTYVGGGDIDEAEEVPVGLLGADFEADMKNNAYRISRIYTGGVSAPSMTSPLAEPGLDVKEGDYILAVNGENIDLSKDPWAWFQGMSSEAVTLTVGPSADMRKARDIFVKPIDLSQEKNLRYLDWVESNRLKVDKATSGRAGYIYVPDTGQFGQNELVRQFVPQANKEALIIDERFNAGGQIPDRFIELLDRPALNYWAIRDFKDWNTPSRAHHGPKVMLINSWSGSGGDAFPYYFRKLGLGPLVGTRTLGGLIGISGNPGLIDGGFITAPTYAFWNLDGRWDVEGRGVEPDYKVEDLPEDLDDSQDQQLDKAIEIVLEELEKNPAVNPERPAYEDRSGPPASRSMNND